MSDDGIFVDILPSLDMVALAAVVNNMKRIFGGVGKDISAAFEGSTGSIAALERTMIDSANRASAAQIRASKAASDAQIADAKRVTAVTDAENSHREAAQFKAQTAIQNSMVLAQKQKEAHAASESASKDASAASKNYADAAAAGGAAGAKMFDTIGKASAIGVAAVVAGTASIAGNWEQMMTRIQVAGQVPAGQISDLSNRLLQLSASMGVSQKDIANASLMLSKAGEQYKDTGTQVGILKAAIELAKTEGADLTNVVQQMTSSMTDFQIPTTQAANITAQLQIAASNAKRPLDEFMSSLHNVESNAARVLDKDTGLPQLLTVMSQMASQGAGMDQVTQNLNNFLNHLNDFNSPQRSILGALGLDTTQMATDLKQPNGLINVLGELHEALAKVTTGTGDNAMVHLPFAYQNAQMRKVMSEDYGKLSAPQKQLADKLLQGQAAGQDISPSDYRQVRAAKASGGFFPDWYKDFLKSTGPADLAKQGIDPTNLPMGLVLNKLGGTDAAARSFAGIYGNPGDPNDQRWKNTKDQYAGVSSAQPGPNGDLKGWDAVAKTWKQQVDIFKSTLEQLAQAIGVKLLPDLKHFIDDVTGFVNFLNGHQGALNAVLKVMETMAEIWAANKVISGLSGFIGKLTTIGGSGAGSAAGAAGKLGALASSISLLATAAIVGKGIADATADSNISHYQNPDGTARGSGDQWLEDHHLGWLLAGHGYKTTAQAKADAALANIPASTDGHNGPHGGYSDQRRGGSQMAPDAAPGASTSDAAPGTPGPPGTQSDPVYTQPANPTAAATDAPPIPQSLQDLINSPAGSGGGTGDGSDTPTFDAFKGIGKGGVKGLIPQLVQFGTTMLAELALGNPHGKLFGFGGGDTGDGSGGEDAGLSAGLPGLPSPDEISKMGPAELKKVQQDIALRKAIINYRKDLRKAAQALTKHGAGSEAYADAEDTLIQDKGSIYDSVLSQGNTYGAAQQKLAEDDANGVAQSNPTKYAADKAAAAVQPGYAGFTGAPAATGGAKKPPLTLSQLRAEFGGGGGGESPVFRKPGGGDYAGDAALLSHVPSGHYTETQNTDLTKGLGDCSSAVADLVNILDGHGTQGRSMYTGTEADWLTNHGFQPGMGGPGDFRVGFNDHHTQATLPGGTPFNWGSESAAQNRGIGGTGAFDPAFTQHYFRPEAEGQPGASKTSRVLGGLRSAFGGFGGGGGLSPVFGPPMPGPTPAPGTGPNPFGPGGGLSFIPSGPTQYGPPAVPGGQVGAPASVGPFPAPPGVAAKAPSPGAAPGAAPSAGATATPSAKFQAPSGGQGAGWGISGGIIDSLGGAASAAADAFAPGSGAAVQLAMKEGERFAGYLGQVGGILAEGALDSIHVSDPDGNKVGSGKGWISKIAGGIAGQHQTTGSSAGSSVGVGSSAPPIKPNDDPNRKEHKGTGDPPGPGLNVTNNFHGTNDNADKVNKTINQGFMMNPVGGI